MIGRPWWVKSPPQTDTVAALLRLEARLVSIEREITAIRAALAALNLADKV